MAIDSTKRPKANIFRSERWKQDHKADVPSRANAVPVACKIAHSCRACRYINTSYEASLQEKYDAALETFQAAGLLEDCTLSAPMPSPRMFGYRTHAKLVVRAPVQTTFRTGPIERFAIGLFQPETHQVVHLEQCPLHRASINRLLVDLKAELEASPLQAYNETEHSGHLRALVIRATHLTEELMLTFVCMDESFRVELKAMVLRLRQKGHVIVSAHININSERTNAIFGEQTRKIVGADGLRESLCGLIFEIGPTSFFQVNPWQAETIYRRVEQLAGLAREGQAVAWDLYCGTGQMTMLLSQQGYRVLGIEENPQAIVDAETNVQRNQLANPPVFLSARVEDVQGRLPRWSEQPQLIVVNPSRRGLAPMARQLLMEGLADRPDSRLLYVSCEAETLLRDLKEMTASGRRLRQLECFDMFPFTEKLEWLAVLQ